MGAISRIRQKFSQSPFMIMIFSALLLQLYAKYNVADFRIGSYFYLIYVITCIVIPVILLFFLPIPFSELGLGLPKFDKRLGKILVILFVVSIIIFVVVQLWQSYMFSTYSNKLRSQNYSHVSKFINFMVFTASTLPSWEFLHRCFLLMGLVYVLVNHEGLSREKAEKIAIAIVWIFECVYHFVKPQYEAVGMLVGSPILSYMALRTGSIWTAFFMHLIAEFLFIMTVLRIF